MNRVTSPKISRRHRPYPSLRPATSDPARDAAETTKGNSDIVIPHLLMLTPPLSPPPLAFADLTPKDWGLDIWQDLWASGKPDSQAIPSGTISTSLLAPPPPSDYQWSERTPGLHVWLKSVLAYKGGRPPVSPWMLGCHICRKPMPEPEAHLQEHASRWWRPILLDLPMAFRDVVSAIQYVVAKDRAAHKVFSQDENRAFATFIWNYDSLETLGNETVRFSDDVDKECLGAFKDRAFTWATNEGVDIPLPEDFAGLHIDLRTLVNAIPSSPPTF